MTDHRARRIIRGLAGNPAALDAFTLLYAELEALRMAQSGEWPGGKPVTPFPAERRPPDHAYNMTMTMAERSRMYEDQVSLPRK